MTSNSSSQREYASYKEQFEALTHARTELSVELADVRTQLDLSRQVKMPLSYLDMLFYV